jgi:TonB family protein
MCAGIFFLTLVRYSFGEILDAKKGSELMGTRGILIRNTLSLVTILLILAIKSVAQQDKLPSPILAVTKAENEEIKGKQFTRYHLTIVNRDAFPDMLFELAPDLPPCGLNNNASRTWAQIYGENGRRIYGFCGLRSSNELDKLWVAFPAGKIPPNKIYVVIIDRRLNKSYKSNLVSIESGQSNLTGARRQNQSSVEKREYKIQKTEIEGVNAPVIAANGGQVPTFNKNVLADIEALKQKLVGNSDDSLTHYQIAELYSRIGRLQDSVAAYQQAVQLKPDFAAAYYRLGWAYSNLRQYDKALEAHQQALSFAFIESFNLTVSRAEAQFAIGWNYYYLKRYDEAIAAYQNTLQFDSGYEDALYEIGRVQIAQGNVDQATQTASGLSPKLKAMLMLELSLASDPGVINKDRLTPGGQVPMSPGLKPTILYKEKASYTDRARQMKINGIVVLSVVFDASGQITQVTVISGLPYGLTAQAIMAAHKIRFQPAMKDGQPISVRGNLEFSFNIY